MPEARHDSCRMHRPWVYYRLRLGILSKNGTVCGITLPAGLKESQKLAEPIFTPSTKAELGDHDENISEAQCVEYLEKRFPGKGAEYTKAIKEATIALYKNVLIMPTRRASSLPIPNLNLGLMKMVRLSLAMRC